MQMSSSKRQVFICLRPRTPYPPLTLYTYSHSEGGWESWTREMGRVASVHKAGSKIPGTNHDFQSINSAKHSPVYKFVWKYLILAWMKGSFLQIYFGSGFESGFGSGFESGFESGSKRLFRFRIGSGSGQKFRILPDPVPVPDPQHWIIYSFWCVTSRPQYMKGKLLKFHNIT